MGERLTLTKPMDIGILTRNSERMLRKCIDSVYKNVPVNRLIIVDGYSTDNTLHIVKEFQKRHGNVIIVQDKGTRGRARQIAINMILTIKAFVNPISSNFFSTFPAWVRVLDLDTCTL